MEKLDHPPTQQIFLKFDILRIFRRSAEKIQVALKIDKNKGELRVKTRAHL